VSQWAKARLSARGRSSTDLYRSGPWLLAILLASLVSGQQKVALASPDAFDFISVIEKSTASSTSLPRA
jgi:hypothetical protein